VSDMLLRSSGGSKVSTRISDPFAKAVPKPTAQSAGNSRRSSDAAGNQQGLSRQDTMRTHAAVAGTQVFDLALICCLLPFVKSPSSCRPRDTKLHPTFPAHMTCVMLCMICMFGASSKRVAAFPASRTHRSSLGSF
jgi:hypothetical protein